MKKPALIAAAVAALAVGAPAVSLISGWYGSGPLRADTEFTVPDGASLRTIADKLQKDGAISSARAFRWHARLLGRTSAIKAGEFMLPQGASEGQIFRRVVLPTLQPIIVTLGLFVFLGSWNDFLWPLIILTDQSNYTLPVALAALSREHVQDVEMMMAGAVITVAPVLILFLALQRYYIRGMLAGSVKG